MGWLTPQWYLVTHPEYPCQEVTDDPSMFPESEGYVIEEISAPSEDTDLNQPQTVGGRIHNALVDGGYMRSHEAKQRGWWHG